MNNIPALLAIVDIDRYPMNFVEQVLIIWSILELVDPISF